MKTIEELFEYRCKAHPDRKLLYSNGIYYSYLEIHLFVERAKGILLENHLIKESRIGILDYNSLESLVLFFACSKLGIVPVFLNWRLTENEILFIVKDSELNFLFYSENFMNQIQSLLNNDSIRCYNIIIFKEQFLKDKFPTDQIHQKDSNISSFPIINKDDILIQLYTSGTTGNPKGVLLTNVNLMEVIKNLSIELPGFGSDSINLVCAPFYHIGGLGYFLICLFVGGLNVLMEKFDPIHTLTVIQKVKVTNALFVPAMLQAILNLPNKNEFTTNSLRNIQFGGSSISERTLLESMQFFNCNFTQAYGLTESSGIATLLRYDDLQKIKFDPNLNMIKSCGRAISGMQIKIINDDGVVLDENNQGEICLKSDQISKGYFNHSEKLSDNNGWFKTGDIGYLDNNYLYIIDRKKDMIISKSENISPLEIEKILSNHNKIMDLCVVGIEDLEYGEIITAIIVLKSGESIALSEITNFLENKIARFKFPKRIFFVNEIIRNGAGKILRREMKQLVIEKDI